MKLILNIDFLMDLNRLELTYENFSNNREVWLNLISSEYFYKRCI